MRKQTPTAASQDSKPAADPVVIGIDWADREHAFHLIDVQGNALAGDFEQTPEAIEDWVAMLRNKYPQAIFHVCIEQSKGALISALLMHEGIQIFPINPTQLANYRKAMSHGGAKGDPSDARLLIVHPLVFGVACAEPLGSSKQQVGTTRTNGENDDKNVDRMSTSSRCWSHTLKEGTNLRRCRSDDLPKTFTFLEFSFAKRILR